MSESLHPESSFLARIREAEAHKGRIHSVVTVRDCDTYKEYNGPAIRKRVIWKARVGHAYENQAAVKEKHESGERENLGLPAWCEYVSPALRRHVKTRQEYLAFQPLPESRPVVEFTKGGEVVSKAEVAAFLKASETRESESAPDWVTVKLESVIGFD